MRKIYGILIVLMLMISISSIVLADDNEKHHGKDDGDQNETGDDHNETGNGQNETDNGQNETDDGQNETENNIDNETEKETEIMNNTLGAEIRLLMLQKALLKNILKGEMAVQVLIGLNFTTTDLESILTEMKALLEEIKAANASSNDSVQIFVSFKNESKNLTTQFRETIRELLNDTSLSEIRERIKEIVNEELQNYGNMIKIKIRQFNSDQLYRFYGLVGEANSSFVNDYLNGTLPLNETKLQLCKLINQLTKDEKHDIFYEIKGENTRRQIHAQDELEHRGDHGNGKGNGHGGH